MTRMELDRHIAQQYGAVPDFPWKNHPDYGVYRHANNKWFALVMRLPGKKLGLQSDALLDVVNLKCDPILVGSLLLEPGFFSAYHMNHEKWITVALDGSVPDETVKMLVEMSHTLTGPAEKRRNVR